MTLIQMAAYDAWLSNIYDDSDNGSVLITNDSICEKDLEKEEEEYPWAKIAYLENICVVEGAASAATGCLKPGWLPTAHNLATRSGSSVTITLSRHYASEVQQHRVEIVRGAAKVIHVSAIADLVEKCHSAKSSWASAGELLSGIDALIYTTKL
jgi:hypothetical protein